MKRNFFWFSLMLITGVFAHGTALADRITIDGGFTSFSGMVGFAGDAYIQALAGPTAIDCSQIDCSNPPAPVKVMWPRTLAEENGGSAFTKVAYGSTGQ